MWWLVGGQEVLVKQHSITSQKTCILLSWPVAYKRKVFVYFVINAFTTAVPMKVPSSMLTLQLDGSVAISSYTVES